MLSLIVILPFIGFLGASLFGWLLGLGACYLTFFYVFLSFLGSCYLFTQIVFLELNYKLLIGNWIFSDLLTISWGFQFDSLTVVMLIVVTFISMLVHLYSLEYMENDPHLIRFMSYLSLFTFFMLILVTANNFVQMFVGWEGVGLSSYLLINFWFTRIQANKAAIKAMLMNRVGDFAILLAFFLIYYLFNTLEYDLVFNLASKRIVNITDNFSFIDIITLLLFIGAMGKSAQIGLHTWLPDAMEGPTPVSALIHAATMVTAGVFLIVRCSFLFELSSFSLNVVLVIGAMTTFFASTIGLFQNDIKKIIAYSTCSQLGYMIFSCGLSGYEVAMFHLSNHAFFKALLFLTAGAVIHGLGDEQDIRKYGGLAKRLPFSYAVMLIGSLALMGFPFLAGFYSKDAILELAYIKFTNFGHFSYYLGTLAVFSTSFYSIRLLYLTFLAVPNGNREIILNAHESGMKMSVPLLLLTFLSIFIGFLSKDLFIGLGNSFWKTSIFILPVNYLGTDIEFIETLPKIAPLLFSTLGAVCAYFLYKNYLVQFYSLKNNSLFRKFYFFLNRRWYFDRLYNQYVSQIVLNKSFSFFYKEMDRGLLECFGPFGAVQLISSYGQFFKSLQKGNFFHYLFIFLLTVFVCLFFFVYSFSFFINALEAILLIIFILLV